VRVLHRDAVLIAVDKPAGVLTVPGRGDDAVPLSAAIRELAPEAMPVHRLDRDTSGVVVFALGPSSHRALSAAFEGRRAEKKYAALVRGDLAAARQIDLPLIEGRKGSMRAARAGETGLQSSTDVEPEERFGAFTYCICSPRTGRTHQIRVHLAAIGHPLAVDPRYGEPGPLRARELWSGAPDAVALNRTPLHALSLRIPHPAGGWLLLESPLPEDMSRCLDLLRAARRA
jgi:RluA family pseudouridine synthase